MKSQETTPEDVASTTEVPRQGETSQAYFWLAVKELKLSCQNMEIYQIVWFLDYGNLC